MTSARDHRRDGYARKVETTPGYEIWESMTPDLGTKFKIEELVSNDVTILCGY
jgi:hypothetical protein